jgi:hypothetical protein
MRNTPTSTRKPRTRLVSTNTLKFSRRCKFDDRKTLDMISFLTIFGPTVALAVDANNRVVNGNSILHALLILGKRYVRVFNTDGQRAREIRKLRLATNTIGREIADRDHYGRLQLD